MRTHPPASARARLAALVFLLLILALSFQVRTIYAQFVAADPGLRAGVAGGGPLPGLTTAELAAFRRGQDAFLELDSVQGTIPGEESAGLGPVFNLNSCAGCHAHPSTGGTSPAENPQVAVATLDGASNTIPPFITLNGPVRVVRFKRLLDGSPDGGVHALFTITGRSDAPGCVLSQPDFNALAADNNLTFRIPTPVFGGGLIEGIPENLILSGKNFNRTAKRDLGITGHENRSGNDGTITRFGWKAQNKSLLLFAAEAYNVEQGVTNQIFPNERVETPACSFNPTPEDHARPGAEAPSAVPGDIEHFANFMRFLAPPEPKPDTPSTRNGRDLFSAVGCTLCHTPSWTTGRHASAALSNKPVNLYSDLLVHQMGKGLADDVQQGGARGDEFRTAPLWGLGQRIFFLHDGRTRDLLEAIQAHAGSGSEASQVIGRFNALSEPQKQDVLNFLRGL
jgi:CxxC motif-containing protein (DUF1111 family)